MFFRICPECGHLLAENEDFCPKCQIFPSVGNSSEFELDDSHLDGPKVFFARGQSALIKTSHQIMLLNGRISLFDSGNVEILGMLSELNEIIQTPYGATTFIFENGDAVRLFAESPGGALNELCRSLQTVSGRMLINTTPLTANRQTTQNVNPAQQKTQSIPQSGTITGDIEKMPLRPARILRSISVTWTCRNCTRRHIRK